MLLAASSAVAIALVCAPCPAADDPRLTPAEVVAWRADLAQLAHDLPLYHRDLYHHTSRARFDAEFSAANRALPALSRAGVIVAIKRIAALIGDAHSGFGLTSAPPVGFHLYPLKVYVYADGIFVQSAAARYRDAVGAELIAIDGVPIDAVVRRVTPLLDASNAMGVRWGLPTTLMRPEVLHELGISPRIDGAVLTLRRGGATFTLAVTPATSAELAGFAPYRFGAADGSGWVDARAAGAPVPAYLREQARRFSFADLADRDAFYVQINFILDAPDESLAAFFTRALAAADAAHRGKLVLDLRLNGGGDNELLRPLLDALVRDAWYDRPGRLYVVIGRSTQSAAENFVDRLERSTPAIFVGEPTGESPNGYGDPEPIVLRNSGLAVRVSTLYWQDSSPRDYRDWTPPEIAAELTSADYAAGRDPALDAIASNADVSLTAALTAAAQADDALALRSGVDRWFAEPAHRYADPYDEIAALATAASDRHANGAAIELYGLNVRRHPQLNIAHDDLADALAALGRAAEARAEYAAAVRLDPRDLHAVQALNAPASSPRH
jgi:hypothetical protein